MKSRNWRILPRRAAGALGLLTIALQLAADDQSLVRFLNGSSLHGEMASLSLKEGLVWRHPDAVGPLNIPYRSLGSIRFNPEQTWQGGRTTQCRFRFVNGDEIYGKIVGMDQHFIELETRFGGGLRARREDVRNITFLQNGYRILYEGPNSMNEWVRGKSPNDWTYRDGVLCANSRGVIGRDLGLQNSCSLAFDLHWEQDFYLTIIMHTKTLDRHDYRQGAYLFSLRPQSISFQRIQPGSGTVMLGTASLEHLNDRKRARFDFRTHREKSQFAVLVDDKPLATWKDARGFVGEGGGIAFSLWGSNRSTKLALSRMLVTEWDGLNEPEFENSDQELTNGLLLVNQDRPMGKVRGIQDDFLKFHLRDRFDVDIPLERIRQIHLRSSPETPLDRSEREIRVSMYSGGRLSFELNTWTDALIKGVSPTFGRLNFNPETIRKLDLNLHRHPLQGKSLQNSSGDLWPIDTDTGQ